MSQLSPEKLRARAAAIDWWHGGIDLGNGVITQGRVQPGVSLVPYLRLPDLTGKTVLDICAWDGYVSFECEKRGASVVAIDSFAWDRERSATATGWHKTGRDGFDLAHEARKSTVLPVYCDVLDLDFSDDALGPFDVVLFLGVLYHMRHPLLALEKVAPLVAPDGLLIVETLIDADHIAQPVMRFYPGNEVNGDPSNWWGPNTACVTDMLHSVGLASVKAMPAHGNRKVFHARRVD